jgi:hypothetical protein
LADEMAGGYTVQVRHDDIHENQIVFRTALHLVYSLQTVELVKNVSGLLYRTVP